MNSITLMEKPVEYKKHAVWKDIETERFVFLNRSTTAFIGKKKKLTFGGTSTLVRSIRAVRVLVTDSIIGDTHRGFHTHARCGHHLGSHVFSLPITHCSWTWNGKGFYKFVEKPRSMTNCKETRMWLGSNLFSLWSFCWSEIFNAF